MENSTNSIPAFILPPPPEGQKILIWYYNQREMDWAEKWWTGRVVGEYERSFEKLCALAQRHVQAGHTAHDLVADLFTGALRWPLHMRQVANLGAYLYAAVKNRSINASKRNRPVCDLNTLLNNTPTSQYAMDHFECEFELQQLLGFLPPQQAEAFRLNREGYSHEEIAQKLNLDSAGASRTLVYRARKKIKELYRLWHPTDPDDGGGGSGRIRRKRNPEQYSDRNNIGNTEPSFEDILMYIEGTLMDRNQKKNVLEWILYSADGFDIISGLQKTIRHCRDRDIRLYFRQLKDSIRERIFNSYGMPFLWNNDPADNRNLFHVNKNPVKQMLYFKGYKIGNPGWNGIYRPITFTIKSPHANHTFSTVRIYPPPSLYGSKFLFSCN